MLINLVVCRAGGRTPRPPRSGYLTYAQGPHVRHGKNFSGRMQMYDGCCLRKKVAGQIEHEGDDDKIRARKLRVNCCSSGGLM